MINPRIARYMLAKHGRAGLPGLVHDNLADLGVTPRALDVEEEGEGVAPTSIAEAPQGQLDVPPQAAMEGMEPEELEDYPQPFTAPPTVEAQAPVVASRAAAESDDDDELADARQRDRTSAIARGFETAGRQFVAGLTRTPVLDTLTQQTNYGGEARTAQKDRAARLREAAEMARRSRLDDSTIETQEADRIEKLARAAALSRERRTGQDPALAREQLARLTGKDAAEAKDKAEDNALAREKFAASQKPKAAGAPKEERLPVTQLGELADYETAKGMVDRAVSEFRRLGMGGMGGRLGNMVTKLTGAQWTDSAEFNATNGIVKQAVGKILEGGKLATSDDAKYEAMLLRPGDDDAVIDKKAQGLKSFLDDLKAGRIKIYRDAGYKVPVGSDQPGPQGGGMVKVIDPVSRLEIEVSPAAAARMKAAK